MADDRATIDEQSIVDNDDERQIEFSAEIDGDTYEFALQYAVMEALSDAEIGEDAEAMVLFEQFREEIEEGAGKALARAKAPDDLIDIVESDIL